ncbi:MAG: hypothetical protein RBU30_07315 [Polyangia bacterium]|nr:hypothetical protein [Polyangia bacterium]
MRAYLILLICLGLLVTGGLLARYLGRLWANARFASRRRRGRKGELRAPAVLGAAGYRVIEEQPELTSPLEVDGQSKDVTVRADYLVERGGSRYVAEVKTGVKATDPFYSDTRRQLLEYRVLYDVEGVVLVDMEAERVRLVTWPALEGRLPSRTGHSKALLRTLGLGIAIGLAVGIALGLWLTRT